MPHGTKDLRGPGRDHRGFMRIPNGRQHMLLAKTCIGCGEFLSAERFRITGGVRASRCRRCQYERHEPRRRTPEKAAMRRAGERRRQLATKATAVKHQRRWTEEDAAVLLRDDLTFAEKARMLQRTYLAVKNAAALARRGELVKPQVVPHGTNEGYDYWGCRCHLCTESIKRRGKLRHRKLQSATQDAEHNFKQWTGPELEIVATRISRSDLTIAEVAEMLGRTYSAVKLMRWKVLHEPKYMKAAGVDA